MKTKPKNAYRTLIDIVKNQNSVSAARYYGRCQKRMNEELRVELAHSDTPYRLNPLEILKQYCDGHLERFKEEFIVDRQ